MGSAFGWLVTASVGGVEALAAGAAASGGKGESDEGVWVAVGPPLLLLWWLPAVEACGVRSVVLLLQGCFLGVSGRLRHLLLWWPPEAADGRVGLNAMMVSDSGAASSVAHDRSCHLDQGT